MKTKLPFLLTLLFSLALKAQAQWATQPTGLANSEPVSIISAIDATTAWAITAHTGSMAPRVIRTVNGGNTWAVSPLASVLPANFYTGPFTAIDTDKAWFVAKESGNFSQLRVYSTINGGQNWSYQMLSTTGGQPHLIHFFDANTGVIFSHFANGGFEIYRTTNGGNSWTKVPQANLPPSAGIQDEGSTVYTTLGNTIWVAVRSWRIYKSVDKGLTWTVSPPAMSASGGPLNFMALAFTDANNGLASFRGDLLKTTDGGETWSPVMHNGTLHKSYIRAIPGSAGVYVSAGSLYWSWHATNPTDDRGSSFSFDHGNTWVSLGDTLAHTNIAFLNGTTGWTGGLDGTMHKFTGSPLGIFKGPTASGFTLSPNPTTGIFTISMPGNQTFLAEVYSLTGNLVLQKRSTLFSNGRLTLDLSSQPKGIYLVRVSSGGQVFMRRVILQ